MHFCVFPVANIKNLNFVTIMKRYLALILFALLWASCSKDSAIVPPDNDEKGEVELPYTSSAAVAGRLWIP